MMRSAAQIREHAHAVEQVREYMRRHRLSLADLTEMGGEDLRSANPKRRRKALHVEKCWALMARLHVRHVDLESASVPDFRPRRRRHRAVSAQAIENTQSSPFETPLCAPNEINDLANSTAVGAPATKSAEIPAVSPTHRGDGAAVMPGDGPDHRSDEGKVGHA